jgi:hypothetical protein
MPRRSLLGWAAAAAVLLGALLVASLGPPVELMSPAPASTAPAVVAPPPILTTESATATPTTTGTALPSGTPSLVIGLIIEVLVVLVVVAVLVVLMVMLGTAWRRPSLVMRASSEFVTPEVPDELLETAPERISLLEGGEPRNAIVAAWLSLETSAAATGLPRDPAETSSEYTTRVLHTWDVDPRSLGELAALYREARFSRHPLGEGHRRQALRDLTSVHDDLRRVAAGLATATTTSAGDPAHPERSDA